MCGFAAIVDLFGADVSQPALSAMAQSLAHRGPDDEGVWTHEGIGFCFRRLAIQDLSCSGHQPMTSPCGRFVIVFNGEIYNFVEIRRELTAKGYRFRSTGDTEVLLYAFMEWGPSCVTHLNGMWSFLVFDVETHKLTACRDHFGIKPLYVYRTDGKILFSSEIKGLHASGLCPAEVSEPAIARHVCYGALDTSEETFWRGVFAIPPATVLELDTKTGNYRTEPFWRIPETHSAMPLSSEEFASLFEDSVALRLRSDVPVGVFLSGGMDSTAILCSLARQRSTSGDVKAYSFIAAEYDESNYINATIRQTGAELIPLSATAYDVWDSLGDMLRFHDEPVHSPTAIIGYLLSHAARQDGTKVILNGQGADETFAGYSSYFSSLRQSLLERGNLLELLHQTRAYAAHTDTSSVGLLMDAVRVFVQSRLRHIAQYRSFVAFKARRELARNNWYSDDLRRQAPEVKTAYEPRNLDAALARAVTSYPLPLYLRVEDRNSMANSIEVRLPFLDHRLVEAVLSTKPQMKLSGAWNKKLLRDAMRNRIPEIVRRRQDKMGFPVPYSQWLRDEWYTRVGDILTSRECRERGFLNVDFTLKALAAHRRHERDYSQQLFDAVQLELWLRVTKRQRIPQAERLRATATS